MTWRMPSETAPHERTWMAFPREGRTLGDTVEEREECYAAWTATAHAVAQFEPVTMVVDPTEVDRARRMLSADIEVEVAPLDELVPGGRATYLKFDIEGAEPDALNGAAQTIARNRPVLAVCLYHAQDHLWTLPVQTAALVGEGYEFHLRRYCADIFEEVLYAVPAERRV